MTDLPNIDFDHLHPIDPTAYVCANDDGHRPLILILHGSLRAWSYSRLVAEEAGRLLTHWRAEVQHFDPTRLPMPDGAEADHPKVAQPRELATWSEGMVWSSPERHGAMSAVMKAQINWKSLSLGGVRPTQRKTLPVCQICGGSHSFNAVNQMRILGRWMRMVTIPNQSSVPKAWGEFDEAARMRPSPLYHRIVDVIKELMKFIYMVRGRSAALTDRYSERVESAAELSKRVNQSSI